ncbi:hypothetical protein QR680_016901 [Steinernema hermaphroditum]|uniref:C-type lectin domain-containing protein n=1 Tax=Steinernema hermaphroditum TaxID=289476 RepID=A0AA39HCP1_9BILA|nr:hypothetical protein QR680_016901 [Steinernema hermaphroditum]
MIARILLVLSVLRSVDAADNPCNNVLYGNSGSDCLRSFSFPATAQEARQLCAKDNAFLPSIHGLAKLYDTYNYAVWGYFSDDASALFGLTCFGSAQKCYWDDMTPFDFDFFDPKEIPEGISCVKGVDLLDSTGAKYVFEECSKINTSFVCQLPSTTDADLVCPDGFDSVDDRCYRYFPATASHDEAEQICQDTYPGAHLSSIHSSEKIIDLRKELDGSWSPIHLGLKRNAKGQYEWSDGSVYDYKHWAKGYPNSDHGACVKMETKPSSPAEWTNFPCANRLPYFCELPANVKPSKSPLDIEPTSPGRFCPKQNKFYDSGYITSPGYPDNSLGNACDYFMIGQPGTVVSFKFIDIELCWPFHVEIYDGPRVDDGSKLIANITQDNAAVEMTKVFTGTGNTMSIFYNFLAELCTGDSRGFILQFESTKKK